MDTLETKLVDGKLYCKYVLLFYDTAPLLTIYIFILSWTQEVMSAYNAYQLQYSNIYC